MISGIKPNKIQGIGRILIQTPILAMLVIPGVAILQIPARACAAPNLDHSGYEMRVCFDRTLSSASTHVGDEFIATVTDPGPFNSAKISGHVESIGQSQLF